MADVRSKTSDTRLIQKWTQNDLRIQTHDLIPQMTRGQHLEHSARHSYRERFRTTNVQAIKTSWWDYIKLRSICTARELVNKVKRQPTEWQKHNLHNRGLICSVYKKLQKLNSKASNPVKNCAKDTNRCFSKDEIQKSYLHMKKCSGSLRNREIKNHNQVPTNTNENGLNMQTNRQNRTTD